MKITNDDYKKALEVIALYEKQMNAVEAKPCWILIDKYPSSESDIPPFSFATTDENYANRAYDTGNYQCMRKTELINPKDEPELMCSKPQERKPTNHQYHAVIAYNKDSYISWIKDTFPNSYLNSWIINKSFHFKNHTYVFINKAEDLISHTFHSVIYLNGFEAIKDIDRILEYIPHCRTKENNYDNNCKRTQ